MQPPPLSGILLVDKPYRLSSMSIVRVAKRRLMNAGFPKSTKVGHGGTLDPLASGLMVILFGKATRFCDQVMAGRKRYTAEIDLSRSSTTEDLEGELTPVQVTTSPTREQIERLFAPIDHSRTGTPYLSESSSEGTGRSPQARPSPPHFIGAILQRPPAHSAMWIDGTRAYDLARAGKAPEMRPRPVEIDSIDVISYEWPKLTIDVRCGKGTYIRSLARDIGAALGVGGVLTALRRTEVAPYTIDQAVHLDNVPDPLTPAHLIPV